MEELEALIGSRPHFSPVWRSWRRIWSQRPPSIQVYKVQSASVTARRTVDDDLDNFGNYFYYNDFYSDVRPFEVKHDFDFCKLGGAETVNYDLERHIRAAF